MHVLCAWTRIGTCCLWLCLIPGARAIAQSSSPSAPISLREIRLALEQRRKQLRTLHVEGYLTSQGHRSGRLVKQRLRTTFAAAGDQRYADVIHLADGAGEDLDENRNQIYLVGDELQTFFPLQRRCERLHGPKVRLHAHIVRAHFFLECLGWWPPEDETEPTKRDNHPFFLHEALAAQGYRLLENPETIDGVPCLVIENPNVERLWFDSERKYALRKREWYVGQGGTPSVRYELSDYHEVEAGIWLPRFMKRTVFRMESKSREAETPVETETIGQIDRMLANQVSEDLFHFRPPPGTLVWDRDSDKKWQTPGGLSWLDEVIQTVNTRNARRAARSIPSSNRADNPNLQHYVLIVVMLLLIVVDGYLLYHGLRRTRRKRPASTTDGNGVPDGGG